MEMEILDFSPVPILYRYLKGQAWDIPIHLQENIIGSFQDYFLEAYIILNGTVIDTLNTTNGGIIISQNGRVLNIYKDWFTLSANNSKDIWKQLIKGNVELQLFASDNNGKDSVPFLFKIEITETPDATTERVNPDYFHTLTLVDGFFIKAATSSLYNLTVEAKEEATQARNEAVEANDAVQAIKQQLLDASTAAVQANEAVQEIKQPLLDAAEEALQAKTDAEAASTAAIFASETAKQYSIAEPGTNLFDISAMVSGEYIQGITNGIILTSTAAPAGAKRSRKIEVADLTQYTLFGLVWSSIAPWLRYENSTGGTISHVEITYDANSKFTFTTPSGCRYVTFSTDRSSAPMNATYCMLVLGGAKIDFEEYSLKTTVMVEKYKAKSIGNSALAKDSVKANNIPDLEISVGKTNFIKRSANFFDFSAMVSGEYIQGITNGIILTGSAAPTGSKRSAKIEVADLTQYTLFGLVWSSIAPWLRYENASGGTISHVEITYDADSKFTFITPSGCRYVTFSTDRSSAPMNATYCMLVLGGAKINFEEYYIQMPDVEVKKINGGKLSGEIENDAYVPSKGWVKARGYAQATLKQSLQLQNPNNYLLGLWIIYTSGTYVTLSGAIMYYSDVTEGKTYTLSGYKHPNYAANQPITVRYENSSGGLISFAVPPSDESAFTFIAPIGCVKIVYGVYRTSYPQDYSKVMLQEGNVSTAWEEFSTEKKVSKINGYAILADTEETMNLLDCDKIAIAGCSYVEGAGVAPKNNALVSLVSSLSYYVFQNWGVGGDRTADITDRFRKNSQNPYTTRGFGISDVKATYITVNNIGNESVNKGGIDSQLYIEEIKELATVIENLGAKPLFSTDWFTGNPLLTSAIADFARRRKSVFHDCGSLGEKLLTQGLPAIRWWGTHPDRRHNSHLVAEWIYFLNSLPRPKKSIKIFRKRSELSVSNINQLNYDSLIQRKQRWAEICIGHKGLNDTTGATYTDRSSLAASYAYSATYIDEYLELLAKQAVSFTDYALIDIILPKIRNKSAKIYVKTAQNAGIAFYLKNFSNSADWANNAKTNEAVICVVDKATYDSISIVSGDIYTTPQVLNGSSASINLVAKGKSFHPSYGYIVGLETQAKASPSTKTVDVAGTLTRTSGTGTSSISYQKIDSILTRHSFEFIAGLNKPEGSFANVTTLSQYDTASGYYVITLSEADLKKYVQYDNLRLVFNLAGTFSISDIYVKYDGGLEKEVQAINYQPKKAYTELISDKTFDASWTTARWTNSGCTLGQISATHRDYPNLLGSANQHVALTYGTDNAPNSIKRTLNFTAKGASRKAVIRTVARVFPKLFREDLATNDAETTTTRQITSDSYDEGTICVGLKGNNIVNVLKHRVDIGWHEQYWEIDIPAFCSSLELSIFRDFDDIISANYRNHLYEMQLCYVSFEIE